MRNGILTLTFLAAGLGGCSDLHNPLGEPVWSGWDSGKRPVSAMSGDAGAPTGAISPATGASYDRWTPVQSDGRAPQGAVESAPLAPPPGPGAANTPPDASAALDPYQARLIQRTKPLAVTGLGAEATGEPTRLPGATHTLPLVLAGKGVDAGETTR